jgi:hypothetical protein
MKKIVCLLLTSMTMFARADLSQLPHETQGFLWGDTGPTGPQGPQGEKGEPGDTYCGIKEFAYLETNAHRVLIVPGQPVGFSSLFSTRGLEYDSESGALRIPSSGIYRIHFGLSVDKFAQVQLFLNKIAAGPILDINVLNNMTSVSALLTIREDNSLLHLMNVGQQAFSLNTKRHNEGTTAYLEIEKLHDLFLDPPPENTFQ